MILADTGVRSEHIRRDDAPAGSPGNGARALRARTDICPKARRLLGKSAMPQQAKLVAGLDHLDAGEIRVHDRDGRVEDLTIQRVDVVFLHQQGADRLKMLRRGKLRLQFTAPSPQRQFAPLAFCDVPKHHDETDDSSIVVAQRRRRVRHGKEAPVPSNEDVLEVLQHHPLMQNIESCAFFDRERRAIRMLVVGRVVHPPTDQVLACPPELPLGLRVHEREYQAHGARCRRPDVLRQSLHQPRRLPRRRPESLTVGAVRSDRHPFRPGTHSTRRPCVDVRLMFESGDLSGVETGARVPTQIRNDLDVPEKWR